MATIFAIANRKGGVGKSTISCLLAHGLAAWGGRRVLLVDLDSQANTSLIMIGGERWMTARGAGLTFADYIFDNFDPHAIEAERYLIPEAGDVLSPDGGPAPIALLPGSLETDIRERAILHRLALGNAQLAACEAQIRERLAELLKRLRAEADIVLLDCPPGISFATEAALAVADHILVPFRPDYVSLFAVDRIALMIERVADFDALHDVPKARRRYSAVANFYREQSPRHRQLVEEIAVYHPLLATRIPQAAALSNAFDWGDTRLTMAGKYENALPTVQALYLEALALIEGTGLAESAA